MGQFLAMPSTFYSGRKREIEALPNLESNNYAVFKKKVAMRELFVSGSMPYPG